MYTRNERRMFGYGQGDVGVVLAKSYMIKYNFPISIVGKEDPIDIPPSTVSLPLMFWEKVSCLVLKNFTVLSNTENALQFLEG